jgi:nucleotide-binding universal stress UspA family protein
MTHIVVGVDGSESSAGALRWAEREARLRDAKLVAVLAWDLFDQHVADEAAGFDPHYGAEHARQALAAYVEDALSPADATQVELRAECDRPAAALLAAAADAALLVVGARGLGGFRGLLLGSVSQRCLQHAPCPVAVIRQHHGGPVDAMERVVVGVDGSDTSRGALRWALAEARLRSASVEVVHAWQVTYVGDYPGLALEPAAYEETARETLESAFVGADTSGLPVPIERVLTAGGASAAILAAAKGADLIVLGTRGRSEVAEVLLGSVSQQVTHHAECPVVVVPPGR